jgi:hypothetical protein
MKTFVVSAFICTLLAMQLRAGETAIKVYLHEGIPVLEKVPDVESITFNTTEMKMNGAGKTVSLDNVDFIVFTDEEIVDIKQVSSPEGTKHLGSPINFTRTGTSITAKVTVEHAQTIEAALFSVDGKKLSTPYSGHLKKGVYSLEFIVGKNKKGALGAGMYILSLKGSDIDGSCKFVIK